MYVCVCVYSFCSLTALRVPVVLLVAVCKVHRFSCLIRVNPSVRNRNGAMSQGSVSAFPNSEISLQSVCAPSHDAGKMSALKAGEGKLCAVLWAHCCREPDLWQCRSGCRGSGHQSCGSELQISCEISSPWPSSYWEKKEFISRGQQRCAHTMSCEAAG